MKPDPPPITSRTPRYLSPVTLHSARSHSCIGDRGRGCLRGPDTPPGPGPRSRGIPPWWISTNRAAPWRRRRNGRVHRGRRRTPSRSTEWFRRVARRRSLARRFLCRDDRHPACNAFVGVACYTTEEDVDRLLTAVWSIRRRTSCVIRSFGASVRGVARLGGKADQAAGQDGGIATSPNQCARQPGCDLHKIVVNLEVRQEAGGTDGTGTRATTLRRSRRRSSGLEVFPGARAPVCCSRERKCDSKS